MLVLILLLILIIILIIIFKFKSCDGGAYENYTPIQLTPYILQKMINNNMQFKKSGTTNYISVDEEMSFAFGYVKQEDPTVIKIGEFTVLKYSDTKNCLTSFGELTIPELTRVTPDLPDLPNLPDTIRINDTPVYRHQFIYQIEGVEKFTREHLPALQWIHQNAPNTCYTYIDHFKPGKVFAEYISIVEMRPYQVYNMIGLATVISAMKLYDIDFLEAAKPPELNIMSQVTIPKTLFMEPDFKYIPKQRDIDIINECTILTCSLEIGPSSVVIMHHEKTNKLYEMTLKFNRYMFGTQQLKSEYIVRSGKYNALKSRDIPYSIIKFNEYKNSINNYFKFHPVTKVEGRFPTNNETSQIMWDVIDFHKTHGGPNVLDDQYPARIVGGQEFDSPENAIESTEMQVGKCMVAINVVSKNASVIDGNTLYGRTIDANKYNIEKYTVWTIPKKIYNMNATPTLDKGNIINEYSDDEINDFIELMDKFVKKYWQPNDLIYTTLPSHKGHNSMHMKLERAKNNLIDGTSIVMRYNSRFRIHFYQCMKKLLAIDKQFYSKNTFSYYLPTHDYLK